MLVGIAFTFFLALAVVVFVVRYQRRLHAQQLAMQQLKVAEQKKRLEAVMTAQENERSRIARDLHDEVGALLSTAKLHLTTPATADGSDAANPLGIQLLDESIEQLRAIAHNLSSEHVREFGLHGALAHFCKRVNGSGQLMIALHCQLNPRPTSEVELHLYRIMQELVNNTIKHAQASEVTIELERSATGILAHYTDNGKGCKHESLATTSGMGMAALRSRVSSMQGHIQVETEPGHGFRAHIQLPTT